MDINETLKERGSKYGEYKDYAKICSEFKAVCINNNLSTNFTYIHEEALDMIFSKISRILNGDSNLVDNWHDIAGYATLVEIEINKLDNKWDS